MMVCSHATSTDGGRQLCNTKLSHCNVLSKSLYFCDRPTGDPATNSERAPVPAEGHTRGVRGAARTGVHSFVRGRAAPLVLFSFLIMLHTVNANILELQYRNIHNHNDGYVYCIDTVYS